MKLIQLARFVAIPSPEEGRAEIKQSAVINLNGIEMSSRAPTSAAMAESINVVVQQAVKNSEQFGPG